MINSGNTGKEQYILLLLIITITRILDPEFEFQAISFLKCETLPFFFFLFFLDEYGNLL